MGSCYKTLLFMRILRENVKCSLFMTQGRLMKNELHGSSINEAAHYLTGSQIIADFALQIKDL